jgi:hypothetical protein
MPADAGTARGIEEEIESGDKKRETPGEDARGFDATQGESVWEVRKSRRY